MLTNKPSQTFTLKTAIIYFAHRTAIWEGLRRQQLCVPCSISWSMGLGARGSAFKMATPTAGKLVLNQDCGMGVSSCPQAAWASSQHGRWVPSVSIPREPGRSCITFYVLTTRPPRSKGRGHRHHHLMAGMSRHTVKKKKKITWNERSCRPSLESAIHHM